MFPKDRALTSEEKQQWMRAWLRAKAVGWEVYALAHSIVSLEDDKSPMGRAMLLEAALTHQRCLIEFLIGRERGSRRHWNPRDVGPRSMDPTWEPAESLASTFGLLDSQMKQVDSLISHVSLRRLSISRETWDLAPVTSAIFDGLKTFVDRLYALPVFEADCLAAWLAISKRLFEEHAIDLSSALNVDASSSFLFVAPMGESSGRAAALMQQADQLLDLPDSGYR